MMASEPDKNHKAFIVYMTTDEHKRLQKFALKYKLSMTQVMREALEMRLSQDAAYINGFNAGLQTAVKVITSNPLSQITFPNQKTLAKVAEDDILACTMRTS